MTACCRRGGAWARRSAVRRATGGATVAHSGGGRTVERAHPHRRLRSAASSRRQRPGVTPAKAGDCAVTHTDPRPKTRLHTCSASYRTAERPARRLLLLSLGIRLDRSLAEAHDLLGSWQYGRLGAYRRRRIVEVRASGPLARRSSTRSTPRRTRWWTKESLVGARPASTPPWRLRPESCRGHATSKWPDPQAAATSPIRRASCWKRVAARPEPRARASPNWRLRSSPKGTSTPSTRGADRSVESDRRRPTRRHLGLALCVRVADRAGLDLPRARRPPAPNSHCSP